ncbi:DUF6159 family protein [Massilia rubra]|uniref:Glycerophosphoryl diester phosphodiesterase membrane domain-containing protein n=1 Tax=Massilia rubra TaxID=2607910 RepID=A0ABX0LS14_9BURK|nr:DUF6159 family protein [Massilia rubra]NHZ37328.1 hypothetical protein [Massilia rubra]
MFDRFKRSFDLVKASAAVLRQDSHLLMFPLISGAASLAVVLCFMLPAFGLSSLDGLSESNGAWYSLAFLFYISQYFVMFYFNAALVGATMIRMDGGAPTLGDGLRIANSRFGTILGYAVIAATVGVILRAIQERLGFVGRFIVGLIGVGWTVATFLVVPVLVARNTGPIESIKDSATLLKQTWGENVVGQSGMSLFFGALMMLVVTVTLAGVGLGVNVGSSGLAIAFVVLGVLASLVILLIHNALSGIYAATLYRYAANGNAGNGFDQSVLNSAFAPKA